MSARSEHASSPSLVVFPAQRARIAYASDAGIVYAVNTGTNAELAFSQQVIPNSAGYLPSLAVDSHLRP